MGAVQASLTRSDGRNGFASRSQGRLAASSGLEPGSGVKETPILSLELRGLAGERMPV